MLAFSYGKHDVIARVADGYVEHIGFRIFPEQMRAGAINPLIADFVERYWLSLTLPMERQKSVAQQMKEDRFTFHAGDVGSIGILQQNPAMDVACSVTDNSVALIWGDMAQPVCHITFPVNHELIL